MATLSAAIGTAVTAEAVSLRTPRPVRRAVLAQWWREVAFLHWAVDPAAAARLLPPGVRLDLFEDVAYAGLIAFRMVATRVAGSPPIPWLGTFHETNVRLYSVDEAGRRGVVFRWMAADRLVPAVTGRAGLGLPYHWTRMDLVRDDPRVTYTCASPASRIEVEVGAPKRPSPLEVFLTARWGLHTRAWGSTWYLSNEHPPWPLHAARLLRCEDGLLAAAGLPGVADGPPDSVLYSPGVHARFGPA